MENKINNNKKSIILKFDAFSFEYDRKNTKEKTIQEITFNVYENKITSIIGPSGCGKSTLLFAINRLHELKSNIFSVKGNIYFRGQAIYPKEQKKIKNSSKFNFFCIKIFSYFKKKQEKSSINPEILRKKIGLVFQKPTPFATSIYENIVFALKMHGQYQPKILMKIVEKSLKNVNLWEEVKDRLYDSALSLSGGQQQRLCIARCLANEPEIILMDEPTSALDPLSKEKIENLLWNLKKKYTIILVTHSLNQAAKISDYTIFIKKGKLIEFGKTKHLFTQPKNKETLRYLQRHNLEKKRQNVKKPSKNSLQKDKIKNGVNYKNDF